MNASEQAIGAVFSSEAEVLTGIARAMCIPADPAILEAIGEALDRARAVVNRSPSGGVLVGVPPSCAERWAADLERIQALAGSIQ